MNPADQIPPHHLAAAALTLLSVKTFYASPRAAALVAGTAAPWVVVLAGLVAFLLIWPSLAGLSARPGHNLIDLALAAGGRPAAIVTALALGAFLTGGLGISLRQASEMAVTALYPHTPQTFMMTGLVLAGVLGAAMGPPGLVWIAALSAGPIVIAILLVLVGNLGWGQLRYVFPLTGPGVLPAAAAAVPLSSYYAELAYLLVVCSHLGQPRRLVRITAWAVALSAAGGVVVLVYLMVFPLPGGLAIPFPFLEMTALVKGGRFFERVDALWVAFWGYGSAILTAASLQATALLFRDAFRLPDHRGAVLPLGMAMVTVALFPSSQADAIAVETLLVRRWGFVVALVLPLLLAVMARLRRGGARGYTGPGGRPQTAAGLRSGGGAAAGGLLGPHRD